MIHTHDVKNNPFPHDIEQVITEDSPKAVNAKLRDGWVLLLVYACPDGVGFSYAAYVLGKRRAPAGTVQDDEFDQRRR